MVFQDQTEQKSFLIAAGVICAILQVGFAPHLHLFNGHPNFALIFAGVAMAVLPGASSVFCGFFAGVFFDLIGAGPFGLMAFSLSLMNFLCSIDSAKRMGESWLETYRLFCLCAAAVEFINLIGELIAGASSFATFFLGAYLFAVLLDCLFALPFFFVLGKLTSTASTGAGPSGTSKYAENSYAIDSPTQIAPSSFENIGPSGSLSKKKKRFLGFGSEGSTGLGSGSRAAGSYNAGSYSSFGGSSRGARKTGLFGGTSSGGGSLRGAHFSGPGTTKRATTKATKKATKKATWKKGRARKSRSGGKNSLGGGFR